jgi:hypothetical protein
VSGAPDLSIVLAVHGGGWRLPEVLRALERQAEGAEVLVAHAPGEPGVADALAAAPWARGLEATRRCLTPELWRDGMLAARGARVALTVVHCRPAADWVARLRAADLLTHAAVGGSIDADPVSDGLGWAAWILRYVRHAPTQPARESTDLAGDNVVYDRAAVMAHAGTFADGFWEPRVHARLRDAGARLLFDPALRVIHCNGYTPGELLSQRYHHGRQYGFERAAGMTPVRRLAYALAAPAAPVVFLVKLLRQGAGQELARRHLLRALPCLLALLSAWGAGEAAGAWRCALGAGLPGERRP